MKNIVLIGMPGSGKSTLGKIVSQKLKMNFVDCDKLIEKLYNKPLGEILEELGNEKFKEVENKVNKELMVENTVISPGGSVVYLPEAMKHLKSIATCVYLKVPLKELEIRLGDLKKRGVVLKEGFTLKDLYDERVPLCEKYADIIIDESDKNIKFSIDEIIKKVNI